MQPELKASNSVDWCFASLLRRSCTQIWGFEWRSCLVMLTCFHLKSVIFLSFPTVSHPSHHVNLGLFLWRPNINGMIIMSPEYILFVPLAEISSHSSIQPKWCTDASPPYGLRASIDVEGSCPPHVFSGLFPNYITSSPPKGSPCVLTDFLDFLKECLTGSQARRHTGSQGGDVYMSFTKSCPGIVY